MSDNPTLWRKERIDCEWCERGTIHSPCSPKVRYEPASRADLLAALPDKQWSCVAKVSGYYPCDGPVQAKALGLAHTHCHWAVKP